MPSTIFFEEIPCWLAFSLSHFPLPFDINKYFINLLHDLVNFVRTDLPKGLRVELGQTLGYFSWLYQGPFGGTTGAFCFG